MTEEYGRTLGPIPIDDEEYNPYWNVPTLEKAVCPVCGAELSYDDSVYVHMGEIVGCEWCTESIYASNYWR
jgi:hypothetical protein